MHVQLRYTYIYNVCAVNGDRFLPPQSYSRATCNLPVPAVLFYSLEAKRLPVPAILFYSLEAKRERRTPASARGERTNKYMYLNGTERNTHIYTRLLPRIIMNNVPQALRANVPLSADRPVYCLQPVCLSYLFSYYEAPARN